MRRSAALQSARLAQVASLTDTDVDRVVNGIRQAARIPKLAYHTARHAADFAAESADEYVRALRAHLARADLRIFTYLRSSDRAPIWELVAPEDGTTAMDHEERGSLWSFFRPLDPDPRMASAEAWWIEAIRGPTGWRFDEGWRWRR